MHLLTRASGRRKVRRALGTAATTAVLVSVLGGGSALAATQDGGPATVSGPASYPPSGVTDQGGPQLCPVQPQIVDAGPYGGYNPTIATAADGTPIVEDVLGEAPLDQRAEPGEDPGEIWLSVHHLVEQRRGGPVIPEEAGPGGREHQHRAEAEHVGRHPHVTLPAGLLGYMYPGEPSTAPAADSMDRPIASETPKSMTRGPSAAISTFDGLRSRCTTPDR